MEKKSFCDTQEYEAQEKRHDAFFETVYNKRGEIRTSINISTNNILAENFCCLFNYLFAYLRKIQVIHIHRSEDIAFCRKLKCTKISISINL